jgi:hypothetical protein
MQAPNRSFRRLSRAFRPSLVTFFSLNEIVDSFEISHLVNLRLLFKKRNGFGLSFHLEWWIIVADVLSSDSNRISFFD